MAFRHFVSIVTFLLCIASGAQAQVINPATGLVDVPVVSVNGDGGPTPGQQSLLTLEADPSNGAIHAVRIEEPNNIVLRFTPDQLVQPAAVMTISRSFVSKDIVLLQIVGAFSPTTGGVVRLIVLREYGIFGGDDYRALDLGLLRTQNGGWALARGRDPNVGGAYQVTGIFFTSRRNGGDEVGIDRVDTFSGTQHMEIYDTALLPSPGA